MSEEQEAPPVIKKRKPRAKAAPKVTLVVNRCTGQKFDPDRQISLIPGVPTAIKDSIKDGSWLDCQIKAGLFDIEES